MNSLTIRIQKFVLKELQTKLSYLGISSDSVDDDFDLIGSGVLDSMSFIELIGAVENEFGIEMDFEDVESAELTSIQGFVSCAVGSKKPL